PQGRVQYVSGESGQTVRTADVTQVRTNMERQFHQRPDGGSNYTVQAGDTLSHISQSALTDRLGRRPTAQEIYGFVTQIEQANRLRPNEVILPGQTLVIPPGDRPPSQRIGDLPPAQPAAPTPSDRPPASARPGQSPELPASNGSLGENSIPGLP